eukprot:5330316-Alexandrium_andersonii.AAC.1
MSASLVGSEMCIRDSTRTALRRGTAGASGNGRSTCSGALGNEAPQGGESCLLYTSDAADDM